MISILDIMATQYATGTTPVRAALIGDTVADLPAPSGITGYTLLQGSTCIIIHDSALYKMQSDGTWVMQLQDITADTYTRAQIDGYITALQTQIDTISAALIDMINDGPKNLADPYAAQGYSGQGAAYPIIAGGVKFDLNTDGTISATQTASATTTLKIPITLTPATTYILSGCPAGGDDNSYRLDIRNPGTTTVLVKDYGSGAEFTPTSAQYDLCIRYRSGYTAAQTFSPMICKKTLYDITPTFTPYAPTNKQLYDLYRTLL